MEDILGYERMVEESMRNVVYKILKKVKSSKYTGNHHFVLKIHTKHKGLKLQKEILERYPNSLIIILQNKYHNLEVFPKYFEVSVTFSSIGTKRLKIPYSSLISFSDPSVNFELVFNSDLENPIENYFESLMDIEESDFQMKRISFDNLNGSGEIIDFNSLKNK